MQAENDLYVVMYDADYGEDGRTVRLVGVFDSIEEALKPIQQDHDEHGLTEWGLSDYNIYKLPINTPDYHDAQSPTLVNDRVQFNHVPPPPKPKPTPHVQPTCHKCGSVLHRYNTYGKGLSTISYTHCPVCAPVESVVNSETLEPLQWKELQ